MNYPNKKGFTLVELLAVIAILAVLATVVVLVVNPAELLKQSRDSKRLTDLQTVNKALGILQVECHSCSFGSANTIYVSIPDTSPTCASLNLPPLPTDWSYACASEANYRKVDGNGWMPVNLINSLSGASLAQLPVDPVNTVANDRYYTYVTSGSWKLQAIMESEKYLDKAINDGGTASAAYEIGSDLAIASYIFPSHWVKVPGNSSFGTSDFWVMKYEAKCVQTSNNLPLTSPDTGSQTYSNSSQTCTGSSRYIASAPTGYAIANISHNTAKTYCDSVGAHLLTNDEWMTIARNAEGVADNWTNGVVESGALFSGHNDNSPSNALTASVDDSQGYIGTGNSSPSGQKRTLILSNGSVIWDLPGNVWEHVQRSIDNQGDAVSVMALPACSDGVAEWNWCQYGDSLTPYISSWTSDVVRNRVGPSNTSWNSSKGVGQIHTYKNGMSQGTTVFLRGGYWDFGSTAGAFSLHLS